MNCNDCPYSWCEDDELVPVCHYYWNDGYAPCEVMEEEPQDDYNLWEE